MSQNANIHADTAVSPRPNPIIAWRIGASKSKFARSAPSLQRIKDNYHVFLVTPFGESHTQAVPEDGSLRHLVTESCQLAKASGGLTAPS